jgi:hypothetical protein
MRLKHIRKEGRAYAPVGSERQHVSPVAQSKR